MRLTHVDCGIQSLIEFRANSVSCALCWLLMYGILLIVEHFDVWTQPFAGFEITQAASLAFWNYFYYFWFFCGLNWIVKNGLSCFCALFVGARGRGRAAPERCCVFIYYWFCIFRAQGEARQRQQKWSDSDTPYRMQPSFDVSECAVCVVTSHLHLRCVNALNIYNLYSYRWSIAVWSIRRFTQ